MNLFDKVFVGVLVVAALGLLVVFKFLSDPDNYR